MNRSAKGAAVLALAAALAGSHCAHRSGRLDFESGDLSGWKKKLAGAHSFRIVDDPVRSGTYAGRFELRAGDDTGDGVRSELKEMYFAPLGCEIWYSFSTYIPRDFPVVEQPTVITQWKASEDEGEGPVARSPILAHDEYRRGFTREEVGRANGLPHTKPATAGGN
jgi:hypothetical protein